ncbi:MAG: histidine kinase [Xanthomonadaceae bacterium]|nr:histidine kinase [Xanthomonadaceae bacterium]
MPGLSLPLFLGIPALALAVTGALVLQRRGSRQQAAAARRQDLERRLARCSAEARALAGELARLRAEYDRFAYIVSHDLKAPLRSITGFSELLRRRLGQELPDEAQGYLEFIVDGSRQLQAMIDGLLEYSRAGAPLERPQPVALQPLLARVRMQYAAVLEETGGTLECGSLPEVAGDSQRLLLLFQHLVGNALKFRGTAPPQVRIGAERSGQEWLISVADNGSGIAPEQQQRVFEVFQRLHAREAYPGIGIGLPVCKRIVEAHGGRIWLESTPAQGTTVLFTLPRPSAGSAAGGTSQA